MSEDRESVPPFGPEDTGLTNADVYGQFERAVRGRRPATDDEDGAESDIALDAEGEPLVQQAAVAGRAQAVDELRSKAEDLGVGHLVSFGGQGTSGDSKPPYFTLIVSGLTDQAYRNLETGLQGSDMRIEGLRRSTLGNKVIARIKVVTNTGLTLADLEDLGLLLKALEANGVKPSIEIVHGFGAASGRFVDGGDRKRVAYEPGNLSFKPGAISYKPGAISYKEGTFTFKPGAISYRRQIIAPIPHHCSTDTLNRILKRRWEDGMGIGDHEPVTVAILDTGIAEECLKTHPLFVGTLADDEEGDNLDIEPVPSDGVVNSFFGHGTLVAGIVAQMAPLAKLNHESVRNKTGLSDSFELVRDHQDIENADIVVMSLGVSAESSDEVPVLRDFVRYLISQGKIVVCAAGGDSDLDGEAFVGDLAKDPVSGTYRLYPADFTDDDLGEGDGLLIAVHARDSEGRPVPGSRATEARRSRSVDAWDYGVGVVSAFPSGNFKFGPDAPMLPFCGWARVTGTSFAAPRLAGRIAHLMAGGDSSIAAVEEVLERHFDDGAARTTPDDGDPVLIHRNVVRQLGDAFNA